MAGSPLPFFQLAEHLVVRAVFFGNEHDMFDRAFLFSRKKRHGVVFARRQHRVVGRRYFKIVVQYLLRVFGQIGIQRNIQHGHRTMHQVTDITAFRTFFKSITAVGAAAITFGVGHDELFAVGRHGNFRRKPAGRQMPDDRECRHVDHRHGIQARFGHVEPLFIRRQCHTERDYAPEATQLRQGFQEYIFQNFTLSGLDHGNAVVVAIGHKHILSGGREGIRPGTADGRDTFYFFADEEAGFDLVRHFWRCAGYVYRPHGERFRGIGVAQPGHFRLSGFIPFAHFFRAVGRGSKIGAGRFRIVCRAIFKGGIFKHAHIGHVRGFFVGRQCDAEGVPAYRDVVRHLAGAGIGHHEAEIALVAGVQGIPVACEGEVAEVTIGIICRGAKNGVEFSARFQVEAEEFIRLSAGHPYASVVGCDGQAHEHVFEQVFVVHHAFGNLPHPGIARSRIFQNSNGKRPVSGISRHRH
jgi:hypothetical protein